MKSARNCELSELRADLAERYANLDAALEKLGNPVVWVELPGAIRLLRTYICYLEGRIKCMEKNT